MTERARGGRESHTRPSTVKQGCKKRGRQQSSNRRKERERTTEGRAGGREQKQTQQGNRGQANRGGRGTETPRPRDRPRPTHRDGKGTRPTEEGSNREAGKARAREGSRPGATRALLHGRVSSPKLTKLERRTTQHAQENVSQSRVHRDNKTTHASEAQGNKKGLN